MSVILWFFSVILIVIPFWVSMKKAGMNPALSLICFIPFIGILVVLFVFAFAKWPAAREEARNA